jgi:hypothetical protein
VRAWGRKLSRRSLLCRYIHQEKEKRIFRFSFCASNYGKQRARRQLFKGNQPLSLAIKAPAPTENRSGFSRFCFCFPNIIFSGAIMAL